MPAELHIRKRVLTLLVLLIFLFGCATPEKYDAELAGWVGKSENKLIAPPN